MTPAGVDPPRASPGRAGRRPERGLRLLDALSGRGELAGYHLLPAARADLLRRLGRVGEAAQAYRQALALAALEPERRFLESRLRALEG